jgi:hypothetical protein
VAEDAADLSYIEADVDNEVAGECVAQVVEAKPLPVAIEAGVDCRASQDSFRDVVMQERAATRGCEHVVGAVGEAGGVLVLTENGGELGEERDLAHGGARLRCDSVRAALPAGRARVGDGRG